MVTTLPSQPLGADFQVSKRGRRVLFHADDMGATPTVSERLCDAWENGLLDGFSMFGNCDHPEVISSRLASNPDRTARIAVHLNLWEGQPISPVNEVPSLVDRSGFLDLEFSDVLRRVRMGRPQRSGTTFLAQVELEWRAQIEAVLGMIWPRRLTALDGHLHVHMIPTMFGLAVRLAGDYNIPEIRIVREPFFLSRNRHHIRSRRFLVNCVKRDLLRRYAAINASTADTSGLKSPDRMIGVLYSGMMSRANIGPGIAAARRRGARHIEVLFHIGRADASELARWNGNTSHASFALSPGRDLEYEELIRMRGGPVAGWHDRRAS
jgi:predicted glycoside hydrolase/deacetylase ChbG (UPF0249 family)